MNPLEMTYTPPAPLPTRARDHYPFSASSLKELLEGYKIIAFRPPLEGETWLTDVGNIVSDFTVMEPRFILKRERTDTERIDGINKLYFANPELYSREAIDRMLHREDL